LLARRKDAARACLAPEGWPATGVLSTSRWSRCSAGSARVSCCPCGGARHSHRAGAGARIAAGS